MARGRPKKQTVDYFPHYTGASDGKTLFILQSKFGNDGYAFWFKLLEILGSNEGHYFDYRKSPAWQFLLAKTGISDDKKAIEILETLADVEAIDAELYKQRIIWSQNFVDNLSDLYKRRAIDSPSRPVISTNNNSLNANIKSISTSSNHQSKVKKSKEEETKEESISIESIINAYQDNILDGGTVTEEMYRELWGACAKYTPEWVADAIKSSIRQHNPRWKNIMAIMQDWSKHGKEPTDGQ